MILPRRSDPPLVQLSRVVVLVGAALMLVLAVSFVSELNREGFGGLSINTDFSVFWGAARLGLGGDWEGAFDLAKLAGARVLPPEDEARTMIWTYPPLFHLLVAPFGALPFSAAWLAFASLTWAAFAWAVRGPARAVPGAVPGAWGLVVASPAVLLCFLLGQNTLLMAAILIGAMEAVRRREVVLAGVLIGLVTMKPQLGLLLPFVLLAGRHWGAFIAAGVATVVLVALTCLFPGIGYWEAFLAALGEAAGYFTEGRYPEHIMITWYRVFALAGVPRETAVLMQTGVSVAVVAALCLAWWRAGSFDAKVAAFFLAIPLATPYAHYYELVLPVVGTLYLARAGLATGWVRYLVALVWLAPVFGFLLLEDPGFAFSAPLVTAAFLVCVLRPGRVEAAA